MLSGSTLITSYSDIIRCHPPTSSAAWIDVLCETDFIARYSSLPLSPTDNKHGRAKKPRHVIKLRNTIIAYV